LRGSRVTNLINDVADRDRKAAGKNHARYVWWLNHVDRRAIESQ